MKRRAFAAVLILCLLLTGCGRTKTVTDFSYDKYVYDIGALLGEESYDTNISQTSPQFWYVYELCKGTRVLTTYADYAQCLRLIEDQNKKNLALWPSDSAQWRQVVSNPVVKIDDAFFDNSNLALIDVSARGHDFFDFELTEMRVEGSTAYFTGHAVKSGFITYVYNPGCCFFVPVDKDILYVQIELEFD